MGAQQVKERTGGSTLGAGASIRSIRTKPRVPKDARIIASNIFTEHSGEFRFFFSFFFPLLLFNSSSLRHIFSFYFYEFPPMYYSFACICDCQNKIIFPIFQFFFLEIFEESRILKDFLSIFRSLFVFDSCFFFIFIFLSLNSWLIEIKQSINTQVFKLPLSGKRLIICF